MRAERYWFCPRAGGGGIDFVQFRLQKIKRQAEFNRSPELPAFVRKIAMYYGAHCTVHTHLARSGSDLPSSLSVRSKRASWLLPVCVSLCALESLNALPTLPRPSASSSFSSCSCSCQLHVRLLSSFLSFLPLLLFDELFRENVAVSVFLRQACLPPPPRRKLKIPLVPSSSYYFSLATHSKLPHLF